MILNDETTLNWVCFTKEVGFDLWINLRLLLGKDVEVFLWETEMDKCWDRVEIGINASTCFSGFKFRFLRMQKLE